MILDPAVLAHRDRHKILIGTVLPRPIAWVSSRDEEGNVNLAPYSFFTVGASDPMTLIFCPQVPGDSEKARKDTLHNIVEVPEFVVNLTNEETAEQMNLTATVLPRGHSEYEWAGVTAVPSETISVPRVAEAPVAFECRLQQIVPIGEGPGGGAAVFGEVQMIHVRDDVYQDGYILLERLKPIGRLAGSGYTRVNDLFDMHRQPPPPSD
ncbi:MAG: flavin reductase family protein [Candidatus Promineifilaceae bacterium]|nr:flavin reductase family protein [Candidatus Promineifilaceae bacterium]